MFSKNLVNYAIVSLFKSPGVCLTGVCSTRYNKIHDKHVRLCDVFWVDGGCGEGCEKKKSVAGQFGDKPSILLEVRRVTQKLNKEPFVLPEDYSVFCSRR
jgi:hypothetical protein